MRYALHAWCDKKYLAKADEIIVKYKEKERILDYPDQYPQAAVTIQCFDENLEDIDWKWLQAMKEQFQQGFSIGVNTIDGLHIAHEYKIPAYLLKHINNFAELNRAYGAGACYFYVDQPLFSSINRLKEFGVPIRWTPNLVDSSPGYLLRILHGTWIRPEDIDKYDIIPGCTVEFPQTQLTNGSTAEQSYFKFYHDDKEFDFDLGMLLPEFKGFNIENYLIDPNLAEARMNCGQRCEWRPRGLGPCQICDRVAENANQEILLAAIEASKKKSES